MSVRYMYPLHYRTIRWFCSIVQSWHARFSRSRPWIRSVPWGVFHVATLTDSVHAKARDSWWCLSPCCKNTHTHATHLMIFRFADRPNLATDIIHVPKLRARDRAVILLYIVAVAKEGNDHGQQTVWQSKRDFTVRVSIVVMLRLSRLPLSPSILQLTVNCRKVFVLPDISK